ncbi:MAG TPA: HAMP domain-containing sensor histidine kinase [Planctomycetota bacterium]|jgi:signal transduction histidine kinase
MKLRARILVYVVAVMAIVFVIVVATIVPDTLNQASARAAAAREAVLAIESICERLPESQRKALLADTTQIFPPRGVLDGWLIAGPDETVHAWAMPEPPQPSVSLQYLAHANFTIMEVVTTPEGRRLSIYARVNLRSSKLPFDVWGIFLSMAVGTAVLALVIYGVLLRAVVKPVERMAAASRSASVSRGLLQPVPATERKDEIGELVRSYNNMVAEVNDLRLNLEKRVTEATRKLEATQSQLVISERLSAAGRVAAGVAHEINNPLGGMLNAARSLQAKSAAGSREAEYLELILEGLSRIQNIVTTMLQFSRPAQQAGRVEVAEVLDGALLFCRHRLGTMDVQVEKQFDTGATVTGLRPELGQVFLNLLVNALDAIEAKGGGPHKLSLRVLREGGSVTATVSDTGVGMAPEVRERAGQFFFSTKGEGKGTGLGLAVVQHIVLQHHGSLKIESEPQRGTSVTVTLPAE